MPAYVYFSTQQFTLDYSEYSSGPIRAFCSNNDGYIPQNQRTGDKEDIEGEWVDIIPLPLK